MARLTPKEIAEARQVLLSPYTGVSLESNRHVDTADVEAVRVLLATTEPPTDDEIVERYNALLKRKGWPDHGNAIWFADGIEAFIGRKRETRQCACGKCSVEP